jgi:hypothetical protein
MRDRGAGFIGEKREIVTESARKCGRIVSGLVLAGRRKNGGCSPNAAI